MAEGLAAHQAPHRGTGQACDGGHVSVGGRVAKPSTDVKVGDVIEIRFGAKTLRAEVLSVQETVKKDDAAAMYREL